MGGEDDLFHWDPQINLMELFSLCFFLPSLAYIWVFSTLSSIQANWDMYAFISL